MILASFWMDFWLILGSLLVDFRSLGCFVCVCVCLFACFLVCFFLSLFVCLFVAFVVCCCICFFLLSLFLCWFLTDTRLQMFLRFFVGCLVCFSSAQPLLLKILSSALPYSYFMRNHSTASTCALYNSTGAVRRHMRI